MLTLRGIEVAFLDGMAARNNPKVKKPRPPAQPGARTSRIPAGEYTLEYAYFMPDGSYETPGMVFMYHQDRPNVPVFWMFFAGRYEPEVVPFLRKCLDRAYEKREFLCGRGPELVVGEKYVYVNSMIKNTISDFECRESIFGVDGKSYGRHRCSGGLRVRPG